MPSPKKIPSTTNTLALRTDFSNEPAWKALRAQIQNPAQMFLANVDFVSDPAFAGTTAAQLPSLLSDNSAPIALIIDELALSNPDHPILVVGLGENSNRTFRVVAPALWEVENNLSIANMDFDDFANDVDSEGIYRGSNFP